MLRKHCNRWLLIVVCILLFSACIPYSFSPPKEIHINPFDEMVQAQVAMDAQGRSHIVGVVNRRIVYYRTRYGEPLATLTFTMSGSGTDWKQYDPGIAVTDFGDAYLVWVEQHGGPEKFACWQHLTYFPPIGGWPKSCTRLDLDNQTTGNVWVTARGDIAYAVYDRMDLVTGRISELMYKNLTHPSMTGRVLSYTDGLGTGFIYSLDLGIDSRGYLHVGFHDNYAPVDSTTYNERLSLHSNVSVYEDGDMAQHWFIFEGDEPDENVPISLSFHLDSANVERVALARGSQTPPTRDLIFIDSCVANGCADQNSYLVMLPSSWSTYSMINEVEILGIEQTLYLSFTGYNSVDPHQVYFMDAYSWSPPTNISQTDDTLKFTLEMTKVDGRDPSFPVTFPAIAWMESDLTSKTNYFVFDGLSNKIKVFDKYCDEFSPMADISSNGIYFSGVWDTCYNTWFSTQAWTNQLPLIIK